MALRARLKRQEILTRPTPPMYSVLLDETVLLRPIGGAEVMSEQLEHLLSMAARPRITVRIVPLSAGVTTGLLGSFVLAQVERFADAAYLETAETGEVTRQEERVRAISERRDALSQVAQGACVGRQRWRLRRGGPLSGGRVAMRDSKDKDAGPVLVFTGSEWAAFKGGMSKGEFDF
ncbi:DUF397 domain-containing protein [Nonomuraea angiospora]|uniref:DUF397 domain-containing protein n=1 Tax=Nonomuraea angiospora TaxID=46172 RepID=UPI003F561913